MQPVQVLVVRDRALGRYVCTLHRAGAVKCACLLAVDILEAAGGAGAKPLGRARKPRCANSAVDEAVRIVAHHAMRTALGGDAR
jgi:hypothetical protein